MITAPWAGRPTGGTVWTGCRTTTPSREAIMTSSPIRTTRATMIGPVLA